MSVNQSLDLFVYGLVIIGLNVVAYQMGPDFAGGTVVPMVALGIVLMLLGWAGLRGTPRVSWSLTALLLVTALLLAQTARAWWAVKSGVPGMKPMAAIFSLLLLFAILQLVDFPRSERKVRERSNRIFGGPRNQPGRREKNQELDTSKPKE